MSTVAPTEHGRAVASRASTARRIPPSLVDCVFLVALTVASAVLYVRELGFHGDDWGYFSELAESHDQSLPGLMAGLHERDPTVPQRPVQLAYIATMYWLFGLRPLGYHLVGVAMLVAIALLLYGILRELQQRRAFAVAVPLLYVLLPNYSGARLWFGAHVALLSVVLLLLSAYAALRALRSRRTFLAWIALGAACIVASGMTYEITLPVVALGLAGLVLRERRRASAWSWVSASNRYVQLLAIYGIALVFVLGFKAYVTERVGIDEPYLHYLARVVRGTVQVNFGAYGAGIPYIVSWIAVHAPSAKVFALAAIVGLAAGTYVAWLASEPLDLRTAFRRYALAGLCIFVSAYAIFIVPTLVAFESAGRENRTGTAATIGVAVVYVGLLAGAASLLTRSAWRRAVFGTLVGALAAAALIITDTQARFWSDAYDKQQEIEALIAADVGPLPPGGVLILDGVCLQRRGAWALTGARDLTGLLRIRRHRRDIEAAAVIRPVRLDSLTIELKAFNSVASFRYSKVMVYNVRRRATYRLGSESEAEAYFASRRFRPEQDCPTVFAWGLRGG